MAFSVAALLSPALMQLMTRNLPRLQTGQWWRIFTPVLVQADGWGQLAFNLLGVAVVGAAVERRMSGTAWALAYTLGGVGSVIILSVLKPLATGAGSSDAVAALVGALTVLLPRNTPPPDPEPAQPSTAVTGPASTWSPSCTASSSPPTSPPWTSAACGGRSVGNASIIAFAHRALGLTTMSRACLVLVGLAGVIMTTEQDGHGIVAGVGVALLTRLRRRPVAAAHPPARL